LQHWMPDGNSKDCYDCGKTFTTFRRRHHCRVCGQIFCWKCSSEVIAGALLGYNGELRCCNYCSGVIQESETDSLRKCEDSRAPSVPRTTWPLSPSAFAQPRDGFFLTAYPGVLFRANLQFRTLSRNLPRATRFNAELIPTRRRHPNPRLSSPLSVHQWVEGQCLSLASPWSNLRFLGWDSLDGKVSLRIRSVCSSLLWLWT
jgi:hypothetical protein